MKATKSSWKRLIVKSAEEGPQKAIELIVLGLFVGLTTKFVLVAIPAVAFGCLVTKVASKKIVKQT
ncbi:hypothetical protein KY337_03385 [Candidatus Woesearchaeota archaeon]|nr:hypothetical protein [Candidatus Woesearchaeota archaeon]